MHPVVFQIIYFSPLLAMTNQWGLGNIDSLDGVTPKGCSDNSGISVLANKYSKSLCGSTYHNQYVDYYTNGVGVNVSWTWFHCKATQRCIHSSHRCDLHPHPDCIYEKDGVRLAEDEEGCFDEYKRKGLIQESANFVCHSQFHNQQSQPVHSNVLAFGELI